MFRRSDFTCEVDSAKSRRCAAERPDLISLRSCWQLYTYVRSSDYTSFCFTQCGLHSSCRRSGAPEPSDIIIKPHFERPDVTSLRLCWQLYTYVRSSDYTSSCFTQCGLHSTCRRDAAAEPLACRSNFLGWNLFFFVCPYSQSYVHTVVSTLNNDTLLHYNIPG